VLAVVPLPDARIGVVAGQDGMALSVRRIPPSWAFNRLSIGEFSATRAPGHQGTGFPSSNRTDVARRDDLGPLSA
jgi:hypothetical protein